MNIDKIREALEAAIEEHSRLNASYGTIIAKVREALAELDKPAEPVAWMVTTRIGVEWVRTLGVTKTGARQIAIERYRNGSDVQHMDPIPLYTHPPQAQQPGKALTDVIDASIRIIRDGYCVSTYQSYGVLRYQCCGGDADNREHKYHCQAKAVLKRLEDARDNGYLAPAAGLTVEEAVKAVRDCYAAMGWTQYHDEEELRARLTAAIEAKR